MLNGICASSWISGQIVTPNQKVVAMCGDGGFLMNEQDLETAVRLQTPIIIVVWCDKEYGMISLKQVTNLAKKPSLNSTIQIL